LYISFVYYSSLSAVNANLKAMSANSNLERNSEP